MADESKFQPIPIEAVSPRTHYIAEWLAKAELPQNELARRVGVNKSSVTRWLQGGMPEAQQLRKIAAALGLKDVAHLFRPPGADEVERAILDAAAVLLNRQVTAPGGGSEGSPQGPDDEPPADKEPGGSRGASPRGTASRH